MPPSQLASRIIGNYLAQGGGNCIEQLRLLKPKADGYAIRLRSLRLILRDIKTFNQTMYAAAMLYIILLCPSIKSLEICLNLDLALHSTRNLDSQVEDWP